MGLTSAHRYACKSVTVFGRLSFWNLYMEILKYLPPFFPAGMRASIFLSKTVAHAHGYLPDVYEYGYLMYEKKKEENLVSHRPSNSSAFWLSKWFRSSLSCALESVVSIVSANYRIIVSFRI